MTVRIKIYGRVQGVFFRQSAKVEADKLGIVGWIRNDPDGSVEASVQGEKADLDKFVAWCKKGPTFAKVKNIEVDSLKSEEVFGKFKII